MWRVVRSAVMPEPSEKRNSGGNYTQNTHAIHQKIDETDWKHVWTVCLCVSVCVTLAWPGGKVGRQESQCVSSQAFFLRLAGFITATNHWPDKSSYFILPSFTSALLILFASLFYFPNASLPLFSQDSALVLHASPCTLPGSLSVFPHNVTALFSTFLCVFSSLSFHLLYSSAHTYTAFSAFLHTTSCSAPPSISLLPSSL